MALTETRKGEIALKLLKRKLRSEGFHFDTLAREMGRVAKEIGVEQDELHEFFLSDILPGLLSLGFGKANATIMVKPDPDFEIK